MANTTKPADQSRLKEDRYREIEQKHFGRCLWQQVIEPGRRIVIECMHWPKGSGTALVVKHYEPGLPRPGSNKPWPDLLALYVYLPVADDQNTWDGLDAALAAAAKKK